MTTKQEYKQVIASKLSQEKGENQEETSVEGTGQSGDTGNVSVTNK